MPRRSQAKAPKDLNAPRRPLSSYMLFNKQRMQTLRSENPDKKITEITKMVGAEWKALTAEQKQPFEVEAKQNKEKYNLEMAEYKESENFASFQERLKAWKISQKENAANQVNVDDGDERPAVRAKALKRPKDPNAPKKPLTGFFLFQAHRRPQLKESNPDTKHTDLVKMASEEWRGMTAEQKEPFESQARQKKTEYNEQLKAYKETEEYKKHQAALAAWKAAKASLTKKQPAKQQAPVRDPTESASDSDRSESEDSSDSLEKPPQRRRKYSSSEDDETDADMDGRNNSSSNSDRDESSDSGDDSA